VASAGDDCGVGAVAGDAVATGTGVTATVGRAIGVGVAAGVGAGRTLTRSGGGVTGVGEAVGDGVALGTAVALGDGRGNGATLGSGVGTGVGCTGCVGREKLSSPGIVAGGWLFCAIAPAAGARIAASAITVRCVRRIAVVEKVKSASMRRCGPCIRLPRDKTSRRRPSQHAPDETICRCDLTRSNTAPISPPSPQLSGNDVPSRSMSIELKVVASRGRREAAVFRTKRRTCGFLRLSACPPGRSGHEILT